MRRGLGHPTRSAAASAASGGGTADQPPRRERPARRRDPGEPVTVSDLTRRIKQLLEGQVGDVLVEGEVSGLKASPSGHIYFCLKDRDALIDCVVWRSAAERLAALPDEGAGVVARGRLTVYEPRGRYQLVVSSFVQESGKGDLWQRFERLKEKLAAEGLFSPERKRPLPDAPRTVGIVTSAGGAALHDMLTILARRAPNLKVVVAPAVVQGRDAAPDVARALAALDAWGGADVIIVGRGGGSLEDLWAFNDEGLARAIAGSRTPVVSAVGHETDFTIADFVADARAATPSEAAEKVAPDQARLRGRIAHIALALSRALTAAVRERRQRLAGAARAGLYRRPLDMIESRRQRLDDLHERLAAAVTGRLARERTRVDFAAARLEGLSPLGVLGRGYALVLNDAGEVVTDAETLAPGDTLRAVLHRGEITAEVRETRLAPE